MPIEILFCSVSSAALWQGIQCLAIGVGSAIVFATAFYPYMAHRSLLVVSWSLIYPRRCHWVIYGRALQAHGSWLKAQSSLLT
ncbi:MAG: hypothetical protein IJ269_07665, partial [Bacteroidales bacterium]|nr:hypothetical protein [Bacteroidales bacterium]